MLHGYATSRLQIIAVRAETSARQRLRSATTGSVVASNSRSFRQHAGHEVFLRREA